MALPKPFAPCAWPPLLLSLGRAPADASIWLFQFMKAMRDDKGDMMRNAHLLGFFRRICRWRARDGKRAGGRVGGWAGTCSAPRMGLVCRRFAHLATANTVKQELVIE